MASQECEKLIELFESTQVKASMSKQFETGNPGPFDSPEPPDEITDALTVVKTRFNDRNLFQLSPRGGAGEKHVLFLHGGGYVCNFTKFHWQFLIKLTEQMNCTVTTPDYPLAPEHPYPAAINLVADLYQDMVARIDPEKIILMGDSAGGGLCLALAQRMREEGVPLPGELILLSPWLDVTLRNPEVEAIDPTDPFLGIQGGIMAGKAYAASNDPAHPFISPINGSFHDLPRISIFAGSRDILVPDARKFAGMLQAQKIECVYNEFEGMFHVWMLFDLPESQQVIDQIVNMA